MNKRKIKACHIQLLPIMSGVQRSMLDIFKQLDRNRYDLTVICKNPGDLTDELNRLGIRVIFVNALEREIHPVHDFKAFIQLVKIIRKNKFDLIHTHSSKTGFIGRWAGFIAGCPLIFHTVHGFPFHDYTGRFKTAVFAFLEWLGALVSTFVLFVNNEERENAVRFRIVKRNKTMTVYNGVDFQHIEKYSNDENRVKIREILRIDQHRTVVGFVGRLWEQKDPQTLHRVIQACHNLPVTFLIVGDGPYRHLFESVSENVLLVGWVDNPFEYYPAFDILIQPSLWEGLSMTLIEAMAFGKPLVAANIKGNRECIIHGKNGFLCTPRNAAAFKAAITELLENRTVYDSMSEAALNLAHKRFDVNTNFIKIAKLYDNYVKRILNV